MELFRALGALCEPPEPAHARLAEALGLPGRAGGSEHTELFVFQLYPYASVYLGAEGLLGGEARDRVAGFWRALGLTPPAEPDHLAALLSLYASLAEAERGEAEPARRLLRREARRALLHEHLLSWLPPYLARLDELASLFYRAWGGLLRAALVAEATELGPQEGLPLHLRAAPPLDPPQDVGADAFLTGLLAPARSGLILVRDDLARAARDIGVGLRAGERRFALRALLGQDAPAALAWLAGEAERRAALHGRQADLGAETAAFWRRRAEAAALLLAEAGRAAAEREVALAG